MSIEYTDIIHRLQIHFMSRVSSVFLLISQCIVSVIYMVENISPIKCVLILNISLNLIKSY